MVGTVSTSPARSPEALAAPMAAWRAITRSLISGVISLPNSTVKAVSPQERYRRLTAAKITGRHHPASPFDAYGDRHGRSAHQRRLRQHQLRPGRELRAVEDGQRH